MTEDLPNMGVVFWPVGTGDSTTIVVSEDVVVQVDLHDMAKADDDDNPEVPVVDRLVEALPTVGDRPYLAVFVLTHADKDHCLGFADLLNKVDIGELWATPRLWREYEQAADEKLCEDAKAFQDEAERRVKAVKKAIEEGKEPVSGDRVIVIGYDTDHDKHAYDELPEQYKSGPGKSITTLDGQSCEGRFEAFIHAPFAADCAAERNDTSVAMQVALTETDGETGKILLFGDLAHETIMKIFTYSEKHKRNHYLEWDVLLAPHHCSKKVMFLPQDGKDVLQQDIMDAFARHSRHGAIVVSSSGVIPSSDEPGKNPPHRKAADEYEEIVDELICTMEWPDAGAPTPVVFAVDADGARVLREATVASARTAVTEGKAFRRGRRLAVITSAATAVGCDIAKARGQTSRGPDRIRAAIAADRGASDVAPPPVGFGR
ncbi:hypothetical protein Sme01_62920 [Sphaerisporangium melleum]|uniref:Metallohydrolase n=1 Tax=Sphaerisporangium melleum TaxID=321316 RepID=A0A917VIC7_9ACTN|nr:hypothetical protein GCM10007964_25430 [Sphaerisporangium melleum]GII73816.1 hypothetical protein Sme01_62920 [Sphaerisporangium melleum]